MLSYEIEEQMKQLEKEIMYLLNKLCSHPPPNLKVLTNKTNATTTIKLRSDQQDSSVKISTSLLQFFILARKSEGALI